MGLGLYVRKHTCASARARACNPISNHTALTNVALFFLGNEEGRMDQKGIVLKCCIM